MAEISAIAMTELVNSNISDDKKVAVFTFKTIMKEEQSIAMPIPQLMPLIELAMIELRKSEVGADVGALESSGWNVESMDTPDHFAISFETPAGGRMAHALNKSELPKLRAALEALENS